MSPDRWAQELNSIGIASFILDSFTGRGNRQHPERPVSAAFVGHDGGRVPRGRRTWLTMHGSTRIASPSWASPRAPWAAVYSSNERFRKGSMVLAMSNSQRTSGSTLHANARYAQDDKTSSKPIRMFHGIADDYVSIEPCREYAERLKKAGADVALTEYPDAHHAYDGFTITKPMKFPQAQTTRHCWLEEGQNGQILNSKTGKPFDLNDPCVEEGTTGTPATLPRTRRRSAP